MWLELYRQIVDIQMGTNCALHVAVFFCLLCYVRDFILSFSVNNQAVIVESFNTTSSNLDNLVNIDNPYFVQMISQIYFTELQLNWANYDVVKT